MQFYTAKDIASITGNSISWSKLILQHLNKQLRDQGFLTIKGKVPKQYFLEAFGLEKYK